MDNVLLHVGYHKTATTWFQTELFSSSHELFEPLSRHGSYQSTLAENFFRGQDGYLLPSFCNNEEVILTELARLKAINPRLEDKIPVLSHERLSGSPHAGGFDSLIIARRLAHVFPGARVFIMIREQENAILSSYFQYLKAGGTRNLESYLSSGYDGKIPGFSPHHFSYLALVSEYIRLFGRDRVLVLPYEMFVHEPKQFFARFAEFVGHSIDVSRLPLSEHVHKQKSSYLAYKCRSLNRYRRKSSLNDYSSFYSPYLEALINPCLRYLSRILPASLDDSLQNKLREDISCWMGDIYTRNNAQLAQVIAIDLEQFGYTLRAS